MTDAAHGDLVLNPDGSFTYHPGPTFDGFDHFVYAAVVDALTDEATVFLSACDGGPDVYFCWNENAFMTMAADLGYYSRVESFEDDAVWGAVRTPNSAPSVTNFGIRWTSNHADAAPYNPISTTSGPPRTGMWAVYDPEHGYAEGTPTQCDVDNPPLFCMYHDGYTGEVVDGAPPLVGVGGYITGTYSANVDIIIDDTFVYSGGHISDHQFFGVVDTRPTGFHRFEFREIDGKVGQALYVWGDDYTLLTAEPPVAVIDAAPSRFYFAGAGPNPAGGATTWRYSLAAPAHVRLAIYDARGRLVRILSDEPRQTGHHAANWDSRDQQGRRVPAGMYFGTLRVGAGGSGAESVRKVIILH